MPSWPTLNRPLIIAHRGASGTLPEHTLAAFDLALEQGADAIELDVAPSRDGILFARHENELSLTTDVADRSEFAARRTTRTVDGALIAGWFTEDFTAAELKSLRCRQRFALRDRSFDGRYPIPTLDEVLELVDSHQQRSGRGIVVLIELKHPTYFTRLGISIEDLLPRSLAGRPIASIYLQSFEVGILQRLGRQCEFGLIQLIDESSAAPFDWFAAGDPRCYRDLITPAGLGQIAEYAGAIGAWKGLIPPAAGHHPDSRTAPESVGPGAPTSLIRDAHVVGLAVYAWTFADESAAEYRRFHELGIDGLITDFPAAARAAVGRG